MGSYREFRDFNKDFARNQSWKMVKKNLLINNRSPRILALLE